MLRGSSSGPFPPGRWRRRALPSGRGKRGLRAASSGIFKHAGTGGDAAGLHIVHRLFAAGHEAGMNVPRLFGGSWRWYGDAQVPAGQTPPPSPAGPVGVGTKATLSATVEVSGLVIWLASAVASSHHGCFTSDKRAQRFLVGIGAHVRRRAFEQIHIEIQRLDGFGRRARNDRFALCQRSLVQEAARQSCTSGSSSPRQNGYRACARMLTPYSPSSLPLKNCASARNSSIVLGGCLPYFSNRSVR